MTTGNVFNASNDSPMRRLIAHLNDQERDEEAADRATARELFGGPSATEAEEAAPEPERRRLHVPNEGHTPRVTGNDLNQFATDLFNPTY